VLLLAVLGAGTSAAQTLRTSGTLEGTVSDATGGRITDVKVSLRLIETNQTRTVSTDDRGFFRVTELLVGTYEVRIDRDNRPSRGTMASFLQEKRPAPRRLRGTFL
jgi:hypothetical protein